MLTITPQSGRMGIMKAPHAVNTNAIILNNPEFEAPFSKLKKEDTVSAALTGKFDYNWQYDAGEDAYLLNVNYHSDEIVFAVKFPHNSAGQVLQALMDTDQRVFAVILKFREGARQVFDDAIVLMGIELDIFQEAGWPTINDNK